MIPSVYVVLFQSENLDGSLGEAGVSAVLFDGAQAQKMAREGTTYGHRMWVEESDLIMPETVEASEGPLT